MAGFLITGSVIFILGLLCFLRPMKIAYLIYSTFIPFQRLFGMTGKWDENSESTKSATRVGGVLMMMLGAALFAFPVLDFLDKIGII